MNTLEYRKFLQVGLVSPSDMAPYCGGSIITSRHILTAAHCTFDENIDDIKEPESLEVLVGDHDITDFVVDRHNVLAIKNHPKFSNTKADYDVSILILISPITFSSVVVPVCLPASTQSLYTGQVATVTGWGHTTSEGSPATTLQEVDVTVISNEKCSDYYPGKIQR